MAAQNSGCGMTAGHLSQIYHDLGSKKTEIFAIWAEKKHI
jgi:hypothetical protein